MIKKNILPIVFVAVLPVFFVNGCSEKNKFVLRDHVTAGVPIPGDALAKLLTRYKVPGVSIAVINDGKIDWAKGYGLREFGKDDSIDTSTLFQAASISKPVSAVAALRLVGSGTLSLDEDVNLKLKSWKVAENGFTKDQKVTLRRLLSHSAGLPMHGVPEFGADEKLPTLVQILDGECSSVAEPVRPVIEPGTTFRYSGGGFIIMQLLLTDVTGRPFEQLAREMVLQPAGMSSSTFEQPLPESLHSRAAVGHHSNGYPIKGYWHMLPEQAAGGLWTTPTDLASFMIELWRSYHGLSDNMLPGHLARAMLSRQIDEFGLGISLPGKGIFRFQHGGANGGYRCHMVLSVDIPDGIVIMTNGDSGEKIINEVFFAIAHAYGWEV